VQFRVIGPDANKVREIAYEVRDVMRQNKSVKDVQLDWNEQSPYLKLVVDQDRARAMGLTPQDVSQALAMLISGSQVTTVRDGIEKVGVVARAIPSERLDLGGVGDLTITSRNGVAVPLQQIAKIEYSHEEPIMWRRNRDMAITVRSDVVDGVQAPDVTNQITPKLKAIKDHLEPAYRIEAGRRVRGIRQGQRLDLHPLPGDGHGDADAADDPAAELLAPDPGVPDRAARHRRCVPGPQRRQRPVRLRGAARPDRARRHDHAQRGHPGRPDRDRRFSWLTRREAIVEATVRRARPVVLTALAAILAMIPLTRSAFWGPMAITIMGGLFVATFLTLPVPAGPLRPVVQEEPGRGRHPRAACRAAAWER
jgi:multidrug efflux pump subunit AcrB